MILDVCSEVPSNVTGRMAERWAAYHGSIITPVALDRPYTDFGCIT
jgi:hypothetical protein